MACLDTADYWWCQLGSYSLRIQPCLGNLWDGSLVEDCVWLGGSFWSLGYCPVVPEEDVSKEGGIFFGELETFPTFFFIEWREKRHGGFGEWEENDWFEGVCGG